MFGEQLEKILTNIEKLKENPNSVLNAIKLNYFLNAIKPYRPSDKRIDEMMKSTFEANEVYFAIQFFSKTIKMKVFKIYSSTFLLVVLCLIPLDIFSQNEDIKVELSFQTPNEFVCHIQNTSKYQVSILLNREAAEGHSDLLFDYVNYGKKDTVRNISYLLMNDINQRQLLHLDSGKIYTVSYKEYFPKRFVKAKVYIKYGINTLGRTGFYEKTFDLDEIRKKGNLTVLTQDVYLSFKEYLYGNRKLYQGQEYPVLLMYKEGQKREDAKPIDHKKSDKIKMEDISAIEISYDPIGNVLYETRGLECVFFIVLKADESSSP